MNESAAGREPNASNAQHLLDLALGRTSGDARRFWSEARAAPEEARRFERPKVARRVVSGLIVASVTLAVGVWLVRSDSAAPPAPRSPATSALDDLQVEQTGRSDGQTGRSIPTPPHPTADAVSGGLVSLVPSSWHSRCRPAPGLLDGALEALVCEPLDGPARVELLAVRDPAARFAAMVARSPSGTGGSRCALGDAEIRSWRAVDDPSRVVGHYACRIVAGRAELVWGDANLGIVGRASARTDDLAGLYQWWATDAPGA